MQKKKKKKGENRSFVVANTEVTLQEKTLFVLQSAARENMYSASRKTEKKLKKTIHLF